MIQEYLKYLQGETTKESVLALLKKGKKYIKAKNKKRREDLRTFGWRIQGKKPPKAKGS